MSVGLIDWAPNPYIMPQKNELVSFELKPKHQKSMDFQKSQNLK